MLILIFFPCDMQLVVRFIKYMLLMLTCAPVYLWCIFFFWVQAKYWKQFVEAHMAVNNDDAIKHIFSRCLLNCLYVPLWYAMFFVLYMSPKPLWKEKGPNLQPAFRDKQITASEGLKYNWKREFGRIFFCFSFDCLSSWSGRILDHFLPCPLLFLC